MAEPTSASGVSRGDGRVPAIELREVSKIFGRDARTALALLETGHDKDRIRADTGATVALDRVTLRIEPAEVFVVMGLSGSGKSTLVRLVNGLIAPTAGDVTIEGRSVAALTGRALIELRRHTVSMVFQRFALFPHKSVLDNVAYGLRVRGTTRQAAHDEARRWIESVGLAGYETARPHELSGGMQQRVGLARALATEPEVLLMDEPFSALDPLIRREMQAQLMQLQAGLRKTVVFITHDLDEALRLGTRIAILRDGRVVQCAPPREILSAPADDYVAAFIAALPSGYRLEDA